MNFRDEIIRRIEKIFLEDNISDTFLKELGNLDGISQEKRESCTVLFADFAGTTDLIDQYSHDFSSSVIISYLLSAALIIESAGGNISAFEGDGIMAIFTGTSSADSALDCALKINWVVDNIIQEKVRSFYPDHKYVVQHAIGIDHSELIGFKTYIWNHYDTLWIGRAANYAANLTRFNVDGNCIYVTSEAYSALGIELREGGACKWNRLEETIGDLYVYATNSSTKI